MVPGLGGPKLLSNPHWSAAAKLGLLEKAAAGCHDGAAAAQFWFRKQIPTAAMPAPAPIGGPLPVAKPACGTLNSLKGTLADDIIRIHDIFGGMRELCVGW